ncbi:MAG TPA: hypothetical protein ENN07_06750 [candidate division Zixibacteria bacterium]|nr:hypothetical protein [candidate division Zixibacteria bacterium]
MALCFRNSARWAFLFAILAAVSCGWEEKSPVSQYPELRWGVSFHAESGIIEAEFCNILVRGDFSRDNISAEPADFAVILTPDTNYYFYSPKQGNLENLSLRLSIDALILLLRDQGYFGEAHRRPDFYASQFVGIDISGDQDAPEKLFENRLNRFAGIVSGGSMKILPSPSGGTSLVAPFLFDEMGAIVQNDGHTAMLPCRISPPPDTAYLYNANSLAMLLEPLSASYIEEFGELFYEGISVSPPLVARLSIADQMGILALVIDAFSSEATGDENVDSAEVRLTSRIEPLAEDFDLSLRNTLSYREISALFREIITADILERLIDSPAETTVISFTANALRHILLGVDSLVGAVETYARPPFAKWAGRIPSVNIEAPISGETYSRSEEVEFIGSATDPEDGAIPGNMLNWRSSRDGDLGIGATIRRRISSGDHEIILSAENSNGFVAEDTVHITVDLGRPPYVRILSPESNSEFQNTLLVAFLGHAEDFEDGLLTGESLEWTSSIDGFLGYGTSIERELSVGTHTITFTATDSDGLSSSDEITIEVILNTPPDVWIILPRDGDTLSMIGLNIFIGGATDAEDLVIPADNLVWTSSRSGEIGRGFFFQLMFMMPGRHEIVLTATDSGGLSAADTIEVFVSFSD